MSNFLKRAYDRFEAEVESDKYSTEQRLVGAVALFAITMGGLTAMEHYEIDEAIFNGIAHSVGYDGEISYHD